MKELENKIAIITGAGSGIGRGIALELSRANAKVILAGRREEPLRETADIISSTTNSQAEYVLTDVQNKKDCQHLISQSIKKMGQIDILVNNAGVEGEVNLVENYSEDSWNNIFNTNVRSNFYLAQAIIPHFKQRFEKVYKDVPVDWDNPPHVGSIIIVASIAGKQGFPTLAPYVASNYARIGFAKSLALELAPIHVTVNALCPGVVWTPMWNRLATGMKTNTQTIDDTFKEKVAAFIPQNRPQTPKDMGQLAVYLASQPNITAQDICVDGGNTHF